MGKGAIKKTAHGAIAIFAFLGAILGASIGYGVYNTGLTLGLYKPTTTGFTQCVQSLGTVGCPDAFSGFALNVTGGAIAGLIFAIVLYRFLP